MKTFFYCENGYVQIPESKPNCWINVETPTVDDLKYLTDDLHVPQSFLNDIADIDERPRTEIEDGWLLTILRVPIPSAKEGIPFVTVPIGVITNENTTISVCYHHTEMLPDFIIYSRRKRINVRNNLDLILRLLHSSAVWFLKYLKMINIDIKTAEKELEKSVRNEDLHRLMKLQNTLVYFNTSIRGNQVMISRLKTVFQAKDFDTELLEDVVIELKQSLNTVNIYSDILTGTMDAFASIISNNVNTIMKRMTSLSIILMLPTLIASFYGMNVDVHVGDFPGAFALIIIVSIMLSALAFLLFKKIKWF
jgi:magnesium transporter